MIGIVALLQLLIAGLLLTEYYSDNNSSVPIPCLANMNSTTKHGCNVTFLNNGTNYAKYPLYNECITYASNIRVSISSMLSFASLLVIIWLGYGNAQAVLRPFTVSRNLPPTPSHILVHLVLCIMGRTKQVSMKFVDSMMIDIWAKKMVYLKHIIARFPDTKDEWIWRIFWSLRHTMVLWINFVQNSWNFDHSIMGIISGGQIPMDRYAKVTGRKHPPWFWPDSATCASSAPTPGCRGNLSR